MKYFEIKQVEFEITVGSQTFSSSDEKYDNFNQFFEIVRGNVSASISRKELTTSIKLSDAGPGDMYLSDIHTFVLLNPTDYESDDETVDFKAYETIYTSGLYYKKGHKDNDVDPEVKERSLRIFENTSMYKLARWNILIDLPLGTDSFENEPIDKMPKTTIKKIEVDVDVSDPNW